MRADVQQYFREEHWQVLGRGADRSSGVNQIQNAEKVLDRPEAQFIISPAIFIQAKAVLDKCGFILVGEDDVNILRKP